MCGVKVPKIMEVILLVGNFDRAIFMSVCPLGGGGGWGQTQIQTSVSGKQYANCFSAGKNGRSVRLASAPVVCGSELVMGALENSTSNSHSSVESSSDIFGQKCY